MSTELKDKIIAVLKDIQDPQLKRDLVSLGMVKEVHTERNTAYVRLETAAPLGKVQDVLKEEIQRKVGALEGLEEVEVQFTRAPGRGAVFAAKQPLPGVRNVIAVASGKGGVGKSTVTVNLAVALAREGKRVGLMDGDIYGPNIPLMLGVPSEARPLVNNEEKMIPIPAQGIRMISMGVLMPPDQPVVWRGPMLHSAVTQFLQKVDWGELDYLLVDLPPGTGDVQLSLAQSVPLSGAVMVTTPQEVALMDVRKGIAMFQKTEVPILGVIENMTGEVFGKGGGRRAAEKWGVPFLGEIPLDKRVREGGDEGKPVAAAFPEIPAAKEFHKIAAKLMEMKP